MRAQSAMELRLLLRNGENLLVTLGIPVGLLVFFSVVDVLPVRGRPVDFLVPGVLTLALMGAGMVSLAIATGFERFYLVLKRLGATPLRRTELVVAKIAAVLTVQAVQVTIVVAVAWLLGWRPTLSPSGVLLAGCALLLATAAFCGVGLALAGRLRAVATLALVNALFVVLLLISGVVFPLAALPATLARLAALLPPAALTEVLRAAFAGTALGVDALVVLALWGAAAPLIAALVFRWE
ncbi:MAG: ABC transporter permease [Actinomycetota bacterium]|nr:ABC transporter permease [Actinomycetota bacterium]